MKALATLGLIVLSLTLGATGASAHCEIPCGIYDDSVRIGMLSEHTRTMEKSMNQIRQLEAQGETNYNQLVRWIVNKEDHANQFQEIVSQYFLTQRIKPVGADADGYADYQNKVELLHQMLVYAMKCKQTTDQANIDKLRDLIEQFRAAYFGNSGR